MTIGLWSKLSVSKEVQRCSRTNRLMQPRGITASQLDNQIEPSSTGLLQDNLHVLLRLNHSRTINVAETTHRTKDLKFIRTSSFICTKISTSSNWFLLSMF